MFTWCLLQASNCVLAADVSVKVPTGVTESQLAASLASSRNPLKYDFPERMTESGMNKSHLKK